MNDTYETYTQRDLEIMQAQYDHVRRQCKARIVQFLLDFAEGNGSATELARRHRVKIDVDFVRDDPTGVGHG
jgi:hypothetical protein